MKAAAKIIEIETRFWAQVIICTVLISHVAAQVWVSWDPDGITQTALPPSEEAFDRYQFTLRGSASVQGALVEVEWTGEGYDATDGGKDTRAKPLFTDEGTPRQAEDTPSAEGYFGSMVDIYSPIFAMYVERAVGESDLTFTSELRILTAGYEFAEIIGLQAMQSIHGNGSSFVTSTTSTFVFNNVVEDVAFWGEEETWEAVEFEGNRALTTKWHEIWDSNGQVFHVELDGEEDAANNLVFFAKAEITEGVDEVFMMMKKTVDDGVAENERDPEYTWILGASVRPVPEPSAAILALVGCALLLRRRRERAGQ